MTQNTTEKVVYHIFEGCYFDEDGFNSIVIHVKKEVLSRKDKFEFKRNNHSSFFAKEPDVASNVV